MAEFLGGLVVGLAVLGGIALFVRLARSVARVMLDVAESTAADGIIEASARRGDLTALEEARKVASTARLRRRRNIAIVVGWALWFAVPLAFGLLPAAWSIAAPLWLLPAQPIRASGGHTGT